jgi:hypothetical protein
VFVKFINLPCKIPYDAKWHTLVLGLVLFGACTWFFAEKAVNNDRGLIINGIIPLDLQAATIFYWVFAVVSGLFVAACVFAGVSRVTTPKVLELDEEGMTLPGGLFQRNSRRIRYADIVKLAEQQVSRQRFLYITTKEKRHSLVASRLPDNETYVALAQLLAAQLRSAGGR